ncbi:hypothetical protein V7S43_007416 [Phytophthora oleae]|uniref:BZIP domain-containing protein n=1 Tax=Phytophthora oleae TaxID=2107226 RepID=A0ABD3FN51_9STRA
MPKRRLEDNRTAGCPESSLVLLKSWAAATTDVWTKEVQREVRRQKRIQTSLRFRARKKQELQQLRAESDRMELEVQRCLTALEISTTRRCESEESSSTDLFPAVYRLALESDALRAESIGIQQNLQLYNRFFFRTNEALQVMNPHFAEEQNSTLLSVREASKVSLPVIFHDEPGWRVYFSNGGPSLYFHPFTRVEFDSKFKICEEIASTEQPLSIGNLFGLDGIPHPASSKP